MSYDNIKQLLRNTIGLETESIGSSILESVVRSRMRAIQVNDLTEYNAILSSSTTELSELIDDMTIPETWFFRDYAPFEKLKQFALSYYARENCREPLRILSLPSSTGEEPYSIAMTLCDIGIPADKFVIDAIDICSKSLAIARKGVYSRHSFRCKQRDEIIDRYFTVDGTHHILSDRIRNMVRFSHGNIINPELSLPCSSYHVIFCRNLLIYFDTENKRKAYSRLESLLHDDGILFIGHSESGSIPKERFTYTGTPKAFAYIKAQHDILQAIHPASKIGTHTSVTRGKWAQPIHAQNRRQNPTRGTRLRHAQVSAPEPERQQPPTLESARQMANLGRYDEAEQICRDLVQQDNGNADVYYLMGLIKCSCNKTGEAEEFLRKAIYLKPRFYDALIHLALLLDKKGADAEAGLLKRRAERAAS